VVSAAVDTRYVNGPFPQRGALCFDAPSGHFKNTIIRAGTEGRLEQGFTSSKLNGRQWNEIKDQYVGNHRNWIALPEFENLYRGASATASHIEAILQEIIEDGYLHGPGQDPTIPRMPARALLIMGITPKLLERHWRDWEEGFQRRTLWCHFRLKNPEEIVKAIRRWEKIDLGRMYDRPATGEISMNLDEEESKMLEPMMIDQPGRNGTGYVLLKKICAVLKWRYKRTKEPERWREIIKEFGQCLVKTGAEIELEKYYSNGNGKG
jgi:hypothetical protein